MFSCLVPCIPVSVNSSGYEPVVGVSDLLNAAELSDSDRWGFQYDDSMTARVNDYEKNFFAAKRTRREARFEKALRRFGSIEEIPDDDIKEFGRKGFPDKHRVEIWKYELEISAVRSHHDGNFYEALLSEKLPSKIGRVIEVDLRRTFPHHPAFQEDIVVERLRNILWAFAVFHPDVGYCQGMNFIAATMMMVVFDGAVKGEDPHREKEELTFWLLSQFITSDQGLHNSGYYQPGMTALLRDMYAFDRLSGRKATNAHRHLEECGIQDMSWICVEWFQTVYSTVFAFDTVLRIWDPIMTEGWKILFRVGVAIFKIFQDELDAMDFEHIMQNHKKLTSKFVDHNRLMKVAFYGLGVVKRSQIGDYRRAAPRHNPSKPSRSTSAELMSIQQCKVHRDSKDPTSNTKHEELVVSGKQENRIAVYHDIGTLEDGETEENRKWIGKNLYDTEGFNLAGLANRHNTEDSDDGLVFSLPDRTLSDPLEGECFGDDGNEGEVYEDRGLLERSSGERGEMPSVLEGSQREKVKVSST